MYVDTAIVLKECKRQEVYSAVSLILLKRASHFPLSPTNTIILWLPTKTLLMIVYSVLAYFSQQFLLRQFPMIFRSYEPELFVEFCLELL